MHFKSPSLGSNSSLIVKVYNGSSVPKTNTSTINASFRGASPLNSPKLTMASPKGSFRDSISVNSKKDKKNLAFADIFPKSTKNSQNPPESPFRFFPNESFSTTSGTLSPTTPHIGSYRMFITGRSKIGEKPGLKIMSTDAQSKQNSVTRQLLSPKDSEINHETGRLEMIKHKEKEVRKVKEETEKELQKKELMVQIYERLVEMCKKGQTEEKAKNSNKNSRLGSNSILNESLKTQSNLDVIIEDGSLGSINRIKSSRKQFAINNSSLYNMLTHKSLHSPKKASFFEKLDAKLDLFEGKDETTPKNREEAGRQSITLFKQSMMKLKQGSQSPKSPQYRVKTVLPGSRMKKGEKKVYEKSGARSEPPNESTFHSMGKQTRILRLGESATMYTGEGSEDQNLLSNQTNQTTIMNSKLKENANSSFGSIADRLDSVFTKYHNENKSLIEKIQELDQKIQAIQESKLRRRAECP